MNWNADDMRDLAKESNILEEIFINEGLDEGMLDADHKEDLEYEAFGEE